MKETCYQKMDLILHAIETNQPLSDALKEHVSQCEQCRAFYEDLSYVYELEKHNLLETLPDTFQETFHTRLTEEQAHMEQMAPSAHASHSSLNKVIRPLFGQYKKYVPALGAAAVLTIAIVGSGTIPGMFQKDQVYETANIVAPKAAESSTQVEGIQDAAIPAPQSAAPPQSAVPPQAAVPPSDGASADKKSKAVTLPEGYGLQSTESQSADAQVVGGQSTEGQARMMMAEAPALKMVKTGQMGLESLKFDDDLNAIEAYVIQMKGVVSQKSINQSTYVTTPTGEKALRSAWIQVKVPSNQFDEAMAYLKKQGSLTGLSVNSQDITSDYYDVESRLNNLNTREVSLRKLLEQTTDMDALLKVDEALAEVRSEIEALTSTLNSYKQSVSYSTIEITLNEVQTLTGSIQLTPLSQARAGIMDSGRLFGILVDKGVYISSLLAPYGLLFLGSQYGFKKWIGHRNH